MMEQEECVTPTYYELLIAIGTSNNQFIWNKFPSMQDYVIFLKNTDQVQLFYKWVQSVWKENEDYDTDCSSDVLQIIAFHLSWEHPDKGDFREVIDHVQMTPRQ